MQQRGGEFVLGRGLPSPPRRRRRRCHLRRGADGPQLEPTDRRWRRHHPAPAAAAATANLDTTEAVPQGEKDGEAGRDCGGRLACEDGTALSRIQYDGGTCGGGALDWRRCRQVRRRQGAGGGGRSPQEEAGLQAQNTEGRRRECECECECEWGRGRRPSILPSHRPVGWGRCRSVSTSGVAFVPCFCRKGECRQKGVAGPCPSQAQ